jgi:endonuclease/exonuclease/phosphatase (EEP) superfamily protein YafD
MPRLRLRPGRSLLFLATGLAFLGAAVHLTAGDRVAVLAPISYAAPYPLLLLVAIVLAALHTCRRSRRLAIACLALALVAGWQWVGMWGKDGGQAAEGTTVRLLFWNASRPNHPSPALIEAVRAEGPDLVALVEAGEWTDIAVAAYEREMSDYRPTQLKGGMLLFSRRPVQLQEIRRLPNRTTINRLSFETAAGPVGFVLVDIGSDPLFNRRPLIREVLEVAGGDEALVIAGDFNTPFNSVAFDPFRERYHHALKDAGAGPIETWPSIAPCLAIDHVWLSRSLALMSGRKRWTTASDHAMVVVEFSRR